MMTWLSFSIATTDTPKFCRRLHSELLANKGGGRLHLGDVCSGSHRNLIDEQRHGQGLRQPADRLPVPAGAPH